MIQKIKLRDKDITKLAKICNLPEETLDYLDERNLLDTSAARDELILFDYHKLKHIAKPKLKTKQIIQILMDEYSLSHHKITFVIYDKKEHLRFCTECGIRISKEVANKNDGKCDRCVQKMIDEILE